MDPNSSYPLGRWRPPLERALYGALRRESNDGSLRFDRFLEIVLYHPTLGYYASRADRASRAGDFITAVEVAPMFAQCVVQWIEGVWTALGKSKISIVEAGTGRGTLAQGIWDHASDELRRAITMHLVEKGTAPREALKARFAANAAVHVYDDVAELPPRLGDGVFIANELFDNLLVRRLMKADGWKEIYVKVTPTKVREELRPAPQDLVDLAHEQGVRLSEGQTCEVSPDAGVIMDGVLRRFDRGGFLIFDYGGNAEEVSGENAPNGTLRAFVGHAAQPDLYADLGQRDITFDVNATPLIDAARRLGYSSRLEGQGRFLLRHGLAERFTAAQQRETDDFQKLRLSQFARLLFHPEAMGEVFFALHGTKPATRE